VSDSNIRGALPGRRHVMAVPRSGAQVAHRGGWPALPCGRRGVPVAGRRDPFPGRV